MPIQLIFQSIIENYSNSLVGALAYHRDNYFFRNPRQWHFLQPVYPCSFVKWNSFSWLHSRHLFDSATSSFSKISTSRLRSNLSYFSEIHYKWQWQLIKLAYESSAVHAYIAIGSRYGRTGIQVLHSIEQTHKDIHMLKFIHYLNNSGAEPSNLATEKPQTNFDSLDSISKPAKSADS